MASFPSEMLTAPRWMIQRRTAAGELTKRPESVHELRPAGYVGDDWHRTRWAQPTQWVDYDTAEAYRQRRDNVEALCFVVRDTELGDKRRFIVFDFDQCFRGDKLDPIVAAFVKDSGTYAERSQSGRGLHLIGEYYGPALKSRPAVDIGNCKVDIITSGQVVVTGDVYQHGWAKFDTEYIRERFGLVEKRTSAQRLGDCWADEYATLPDEKQYLVDDMRAWAPCVEGHGGDVGFYTAACHLARHGVTGNAARELLAEVSQQPPFSDDETTHKIERAYQQVHDDGEFDTYDENGQKSRTDEFDAVSDERAEMTEEEAQFFNLTGFEGLSLVRHLAIFSQESMPDFILQDMLFETGAIVLGGQNKTFKTTIGLDLLVSLATGAKFLDHFELQCDRKRVAVFSSETVKHLMTQYLQCILRSKRLHPDDVGPFTINSTVPLFERDREGKIRKHTHLEKYLRTHRPEVVMFDPLYQMFLGVNQADISAMGQALQFVEQTCAKWGAMPIFCHHSRKPSTLGGNDFPLMTLNDLSGAGGGAFARQWILLSHTRKYISGSARLHANVGASGADEQQWIIDLNTYGPNRERCWRTKVAKVNLAEEIIYRLQMDGTSTVKQLATRLRANEYEIEQIVDRMEEQGRVTQLSNKVSLVSQKEGEYDV